MNTSGLTAFGPEEKMDRVSGAETPSDDQALSEIQSEARVPRQSFTFLPS
jgi:hypothetical protein